MNRIYFNNQLINFTTMKTILKFVMVIAAIFAVSVNDVEAKAKKKLTCVIEAEIDCEGCASKIKKNIAFEKGVKSLEVSVAEQTVTITYLEGKNTPEELAKAITKLGYKAKVKEEPKKKE